MAAGYVTTLRNAMLDAITTAVGAGGKLVLYAGARPATGGAAGTVLATWTLGTPFAPASASGVLSPTLPVDVVASASGTATWARIFKADGVTIVMDLSVGTSAADLILNTVSILVGVACSITGFSITDGNP